MGSGEREYKRVLYSTNRYEAYRNDGWISGGQDIAGLASTQHLGVCKLRPADENVVDCVLDHNQSWASSIADTAQGGRDYPAGDRMGQSGMRDREKLPPIQGHPGRRMGSPGSRRGERGLPPAGSPGPFGMDPRRIDRLQRIIRFYHSVKPSYFIWPAIKTYNEPESTEAVSEPAAVKEDVSKEKQKRLSIPLEGAPETQRREELASIPRIAYDPRYLQVLKKICNMGRAESVAYIREQRRNLMERCKVNRADDLGTDTYVCVEDDEAVRVLATEKEQEIDIIKIPEIAPVTCPPFNMDDFDYIVYKNKENFHRLSAALRLSLAEAILVYYLHVHRVGRTTQALLDTVAAKDWANEEDRALFEANYHKYGRKLWKYQMPRTERELKMYYKYYVRRMIIQNWAPAERDAFGRAYDRYRKRWASYVQEIPSKTPAEIKSYYQEYYRKTARRRRHEEKGGSAIVGDGQDVLASKLSSMDGDIGGTELYAEHDETGLSGSG